MKSARQKERVIKDMNTKEDYPILEGTLIPEKLDFNILLKVVMEYKYLGGNNLN